MPQQMTTTAAGIRPHAVAGAPLMSDARENGMTGDGTTNDQPALAALVDRLGDAYDADGRARVIYCPPGVYLIRDAGTVWRSGVSLMGAGPGATRFLLSNEGNRAEPVPLAFYTAQLHGASPDRHLAYCTFADFEIDGSGVSTAAYSPLAKGLGLQYVIGGLFRNLYIHHTAATGFGCDFLQDTLIDAVRVVGCGRLDSGLEMGGAGIGIGVGGWGSVERLTITNCSAVGNATNGIFLEMQNAASPQPRGIRIIGCHAQGNRFGISDWGADGLIVTGCTMTGNLEAGFQVSAKGTTGIPGKGGLLTDCVIDGNLRDGVSIGNTCGPYTVRGNRISGNGRYGYHHQDLGDGDQTTAEEIVIESNDIWGNSLDGLRFDRPLRDSVVINNRVRNNGRQCAPATSGGGGSVRYSDTTVIDREASWPKDGHRGKVLRVGDRYAVVAANDENTLTLAPVRPGVRTGWSADTPLPGTPYELPDPPANRAGVTLNATVDSLTIRGNLIRDNGPGTQTHGLWITERGSCLNCRVVENDLDGNAVPIQADSPAVGGHWAGNHGEP
ncbi:right-handed parallel beta-helix repeat-containing protein [Micromonospora globbae]|uniref:Right-handed parallel beta-helix repeat-containing protein n=1 Tax=Micromonospora globbae TaxID=1894969 RepID=A0A420EUL9_9ACTN|nr:right-handed parallel beta-helix repeat-containing protein [Micromonospora globbae]RKF24340.1 right-handed parallel beta-helix repeat-containing protein [Micromonospora globbae]WTF83504.1 right-handed parallel beta-helix repeat-containing protein [Micromonospora globbae]